MSMFDSVWTRCPVCSTEIEFQSKVGDCSLSNYRYTSVPISIASSLDGEEKVCPSCTNIVKLSYANKKPDRVRMEVNIKLEEDASYD